MTYARTLVQDFSTANKIYAGATVTFWVVDNGLKTNVKADLFQNITGNNKTSTPQVLDGYGKFRTPVYIQTAVIAEVTGFGNAPDHQTGIIPAGAEIISGTGSPEGVVTANIGTLYLRDDGGVNTTLYVKQSGTGNTGWSGK